MKLQVILKTLAFAAVLGACGSIPGGSTDQPLEAGATDAGRDAASPMETVDASDGGRVPPVTEACGNGLRNPGEECDDGNRVSFDGCSSECLVDEVAICGDGIVSGAEDCDDGGPDAGAASPDAGPPPSCTDDCRFACGNAELDDNEECDDGNADNSDGCSAACTIIRCGNERVDFGEACDDGNKINNDGCPANCSSVCGNGKRELQETCDDGNNKDGDECAADCGPVACGDAVKEGLEECDDGNSNNLDTCSDTCKAIACGNGRTDEGEACDGGPNDSDEKCTEDCTLLPKNCGDSIVQQGEGEQCDDGNRKGGDGCRYCLKECGNGILDSKYGEQCEPGLTQGRYCLKAVTNTCIKCAQGSMDCELREPCNAATCTWLPQCGDAILQASVGEECDPPDGTSCSSTCKTIPAVCGDGKVQNGEDCDTPNDPTCVDCKLIIPATCGNGQVDTGEECDSLDRYLCTEACKFPTCEPTVRAPLIVNGDFASSTAPWQAEAPAVLRLETTDGKTAPGSLEVRFEGPVATTAQVTGARVCVPVTSGRHTLKAYYKIPIAQAGLRASAGLFLHRQADCQDVPTAPPASPARGNITGAWTEYTSHIDVPTLGPDEKAFVRVRMETLRLADTPGGVVLWDDVQLTPETVTAGFCGDCKLDAAETCDDGNTVAGDGCDATCLREQCVLGTEAACSDCDKCAFSKCETQFDGCLGLTGNAEDGPGKGLPRSLLCNQLRACAHETGCAGETAVSDANLLIKGPALENCYCGSAGLGCQSGGASGLCQLEVEAALESGDPVEIFQRFSGSDPAYPTFSVAQSLLSCEKSSACACTEAVACGNGILQDRSATFRTENVACANATATIPGCFIEECDEGEASTECDANCFFLECGNSITQPGEDCDDGNQTSGDGCDSDCQAEYVCGDGVVHPKFEDCDTELSAATPLCLQSELDMKTKTLSQCGCTAEVLTPGGPEVCTSSVCGNGVIQADAGEECDPPGPTCTDECKRGQVDPCTSCLLEFDGRDTEGLASCVGAAGFLSDTKPFLGGTDFVGYGCLADAKCFELWQCAVETNCRNKPGPSFFLGCYCGDDVKLEECASPSFVPKGSCKNEILAAREAQLGFPFKSNAELIAEIGYSFVYPELNTQGGGRYPSLNVAANLISTCLDENPAFSLKADLETAKAANRLGPYTVDQCLAACIKP